MTRDLGALVAYLNALQNEMIRWGPGLTFIALFVECIPILSVAAPGLTILVLAGFIAASQSHGYVLASFVAAAAGVFVADVLAYAVGRLAAERVSPIRRYVNKHSDLQRELCSQPLPILCLYQFPPYSRMLAPLLLGAIGTSWDRWWIVVSIGTGAFVCIFFGIGFAAGTTSRAAVGAVDLASGISAAFVAALLVWGARVAVRVARRYRTTVPTS